MNTLKNCISDLQSLKINTYNSDFLLTWQKSDDEIRALSLIAECLYEMHRAGKPFRVFDTGLAISIFRDNSTRTRFSFASAVNTLGLGLSELDEQKSQIAHGETVRETATATTPASAKKKLSYLEAREYDSLEASIEGAEADLRTKLAALHDPSIMSDAPKLQLAIAEVLHRPDIPAALHAFHVAILHDPASGRSIHADPG